MHSMILLINPPIVRPFHPIPATAVLAAYLKSKGIDAHQLDANLSFWKWISLPRQVNELYDDAAGYHSLLSRSGDATFSDRLKLQASQQVMQYENCNAAMKALSENGEDLLHQLGLLMAYKHEGKRGVFSSRDMEVNPRMALFEDFMLSRDYACSGLNDLIEIMEKEESIFPMVYRDCSLLDEIYSFDPEIIGLSIFGPLNVVPAFALARELRRDGYDGKILIGGAWISLFGDVLEDRRIFDYIDGIVRGEGEIPLFAYGQTLSGDKSLHDVPGLVFMNNGTVVRNAPVVPIPLADLPTPDFDNLFLRKYWERGTLTIPSSRGCAWGKCTFCNLKRNATCGFMVRPVKLLASDFIELKNRYAAEKIIFTDTGVAPTVLAHLDGAFRSLGVSRAGDNLPRWHAFARVNANFTDKIFVAARQSGCESLCWGIESGSDGVLEKMRKGFTVQQASRILHLAADSGIKNYVHIIMGFPGEKDEDIQATLDFLASHKNVFYKASVLRFKVTRESAIHHHPDRFGVKILQDDKDNALCLDLPFIYDAGPSEEMLADAESRIKNEELSEGFQ